MPRIFWKSFAPITKLRQPLAPANGCSGYVPRPACLGLVSTPLWGSGELDLGVAQWLGFWREGCGCKTLDLTAGCICLLSGPLNVKTSLFIVTMLRVTRCCTSHAKSIGDVFRCGSRAEWTTHVIEPLGCTTAPLDGTPIDHETCQERGARTNQPHGRPDRRPNARDFTISLPHIP
jgi:hypothetical protein